MVAEILAAAVAVLLWERSLSDVDRAVWQQLLTIAGEVLFGLVVADLLTMAVRRMIGLPVLASRVTVLLYVGGLACWLLIALLAPVAGYSSAVGLVGGSVLLLLTVGVATWCERGR